MSGIVRVQKNKENPYAMIDKLFLSNDNLSWKSKGLLSYLLSKPDNWVISISDLLKKSQDGERSTRTALKELIEQNYIQRYPIYQGNRIVDWESIVYEIPHKLEEKIKYVRLKENGVREIVLHDKTVLCDNVKLQSEKNQVEKIMNEQIGNEELKFAGLIINDSKDDSLKVNNQSINPPENEGLTEILKKIDTEYLIANGVSLQFIDVIKGTITDMFFMKELSVSGAVIPSPVIKSRLRKINSFTIQYIANQFNTITLQQKIINPKSYIVSMIYNSSVSEELAVSADINFNVYGNGRISQQVNK